MSYLKPISWLFCLLFPICLKAQSPEFSFRVPELAGTLRIGLVNGEESVWAHECKVTNKTQQDTTVYTLRHSLTGKGRLILRTRPLKDTKGIVIEVRAENLPEHTHLFWAFGGACGEMVTASNSPALLLPEYCKDNVFSIERTSFTVYYETNRKLRTFNGITPLNSDIRLSDARRQQSPLSFFRSGKKTDAPALTATCPLKNGENIYFCFYKRNSQADYNYFMLPELFLTGSIRINPGNGPTAPTAK